MNCNHAQDAVLLQASGELDDAGRNALQAHLESCPACRAYRQDLLQIEQAEERYAAVPEVPGSVLRAIRERAADRPGPLTAFFDLWHPALVYGAAALVVLLFCLNLLRRVPEQAARSTPPAGMAVPAAASPVLAWDPDLDQQISELDTLFASVAYDVGTEANGNGEDSLDDLAAELLELEGWNI